MSVDLMLFITGLVLSLLIFFYHYKLRELIIWCYIGIKLDYYFALLRHSYFKSRDKAYHEFVLGILKGGWSDEAKRLENLYTRAKHELDLAKGKRKLWLK